MVILVTGSNGMIGSKLVKGLLDAGQKVVGIDRSKSRLSDSNYYHYQVDLSEIDQLRKVFTDIKIDRVIHLAALAHTVNETDLSWARYYHINVTCASNIFKIAFENGIPVLFISTVDVYGFKDGVVNSNSIQKPVTKYGKSKSLAERELRRLSAIYSIPFTIFRFSPVYTDEVKRDIQKRYYLKYPNVAYLVGKGQEYEILNVKKAVEEMVRWCSDSPNNEAKILKDLNNMWTPDYIRAEKEAGRAKVVIHIPKVLVRYGYALLKRVIGENDKTYLINKAVHPLRTE